MKTCPICDTENKPQATHCEVCGERLSPPAPGEEVAPEENVLAQLTAAAAAKPVPVPVPAAPRVTAPAMAPAAIVPELIAPAPPRPAEPPPVAPPPTEPTPEPEPVAPLMPEVFVPAPPPSRPTPRPVATEDRLRIVSSGIPDARMVIYQNKQPAHTHPIVNDETLVGRYDPVSGAFPDLDLTEFDTDSSISRKHVYIYRQNREYYLYPVSNGGTQLNSELVDMGSKRKLKDGDVIILAAKLAMKFHIDG